jgi:pimeloyl-ACP methyl ester carboxylesterase
MENERCIVDGVNVRFRDTGAGSVVLLLHGWGDTLATFDALIPELGDTRSVRLDLPGFGESEPPGPPWDVSRYAVFVRHFLDKLGIAEPDVLVGHSFGGRIAIKGIASGILKPKHLILIASAGAAAQGGARRRVFSFFAKTGKFLTAFPPLSFFRERLREQLYRLAGSVDCLQAGLMRETFLKIISENLVADAAKMHVPTILVWGERDTETPLAEARVLEKAMANARLAIIPGAGHFVHRDLPKETAREIHAFIIQ